MTRVAHLVIHYGRKVQYGCSINHFFFKIFYQIQERKSFLGQDGRLLSNEIRFSIRMTRSIPGVQSLYSNSLCLFYANFRLLLSVFKIENDSNCGSIDM